MKRNINATLFLALLSVWMAVPACKTVSTPGPDGPPSPISQFEFCSTDALKTAGANLLGDIANAVATGDYEGELKKLLVKATLAEINCGVELFVNATQRKASADALAATQVQNAKAWLAKQQGQ